MLGDIIRGILEAASGVEVAGDFSLTEVGFDAVEAAGADVVIAPSDRPELPDVWRRLLVRRPQTKVLTVGGDGREGFLYELRPYQVPLGEISPQTLIDAVKSPRVLT